MSFKQVNGERYEDSRRFIDFTEITLRQKWQIYRGYQSFAFGVPKTKRIVLEPNG